MNTSTLSRGMTALAAMTIIVTAPARLDAQTPRPHPASDPAAVAILERHTKGLGGGAQPEYSHFIQEMQIAGGPVIRTEVYMALPGRIFMRNTMGGQTVLEFGFDGATGWTSSPMTGVVRLAGPQLEAMRASVASVTAPSFDTTARLVATGRSRLDDQPVDGILAIAATGDTVEAFFAVSTGLLAGARTRANGGGQADSSLMLFRDYKRSGGQMVPTTMIMRMPGMEAVTRTVHQDNDPIPPERFRQP